MSTTLDGEFPVTIQHKFGSTRIPAAPRRIVSVGYDEQDFVLALGVKPFARLPRSTPMGEVVGLRAGQERWFLFGQGRRVLH